MSSAKPKYKRRDTRLRFEQFAKHPRCEANVTSAVLGIPMNVVADAERSDDERDAADTFGQSPFALAQGVTFEKSLFAKAAERLRVELAANGVIPADKAAFLDLRLKANGGPSQKLDDAARATTQLLASLAEPKTTPQLPILVAGAALELPGEPILLPEAMLALDALVLRDAGDNVELVVGEVKTYADRAGFTDRAELATARAQAGVYAHALDMAIARLRLAGRVRVAARGFLVLAKPGSAFPRVRAEEEVRYQAHRAERGFVQLREAARGLRKTFAEPPTDAEAAAVLAAETCYRPSCVSFCERAERCHALAFEAGNPAVLGDEAKQFLGGLTLDRAAELLGGARAMTPVEESFVARARALEEVSS